MEEQVAVLTPESVDFSLDVAGLGSRGVALLIDEAIKGLVAGLVGGGAFFLASRVGLKTMSGMVTLAVGLILAFLIFSIYHIVLEAAWSGRTIGKRIMGLRVVKDTGVPIGFVDALLRNLLRLVDALPTFYTVGAVAIFISDRHKRLGDLAATTLVIKERSLREPAVSLSTIVAGTLGSAQPALGLPRVGYREAELVRNFLARRDALAPAPRQDLAQRLAASLRRQGVTRSLVGLSETAGDEEFLAAWQALQG